MAVIVKLVIFYRHSGAKDIILLALVVSIEIKAFCY